MTKFWNPTGLIGVPAQFVERGVISALLLWPPVAQVSANSAACDRWLVVAWIVLGQRQ